MSRNANARTNVPPKSFSYHPIRTNDELCLFLCVCVRASERAQTYRIYEFGSHFLSLAELYSLAAARFNNGIQNFLIIRRRHSTVQSFNGGKRQEPAEHHS